MQALHRSGAQQAPSRCPAFATTPRCHPPQPQRLRMQIRCQSAAEHTSSSSSSSSSSRRELLSGAACGAASLLLAGRCAAAAAAAEEGALQVAQAEVAASSVTTTSSSSAAAATVPGGRQVFFDVSVEGEPVGRIVVALLRDAGVGGQRFADLAEGKEGVGYRLSKFDGIFPTYIRNEGVKSLSYNADGSSLIAGGASVQDLEQELAASSRSHDTAGLVSIVVREAQERPVKERLVAMGGKLVTLKEQAGEAPNGTSFIITTGPTPELDRTNLVVGQVVEGFDVVQRLASLPFAKPRDSYYDKPFFAAGKMMGDKRATFAESRFNRPIKRVLIAKAGLVS